MPSQEREPVKDLETLGALDERDLLSGYWAGFRGDGNEPSLEMNRSYWHGWRNGMVDSGRMKTDAAQMELAHLYLNRKR